MATRLEGKPGGNSKNCYTIKSAARYLDVSDKSIRRLIKSGVLRASTVLPGKILIPARDVENLVESTS